MDIRDLGALDAPVLVCGGAYGNLEALEALGALQAALDVPDTHVIHGGDAVAYCADAEPCVRFIQSRGWHAIKGNVEEQIAAGAGTCGCGFAEGSACDVAAARWYSYAQQQLSQASVAWMAGLPDQLVLTMAGLQVRVVHGGVTASNRFMFGSLCEEAFGEQFAAAGHPDVIIAGHTGIPFTRRFGRQVWHNTGALGMPANDGTTRTWASLVSPLGEGAVELRHLALTFDAHCTARKMRRAGLPSGYADALVSGLWPSLDVLPPVERTKTGTALACDATPFAAGSGALRAAAE